jgi:hypothetical protein
VLQGNKATEEEHVMTPVVMAVQAYQILLLAALLFMLVAEAAVNEI